MTIELDTSDRQIRYQIVPVQAGGIAGGASVSMGDSSHADSRLEGQLAGAYNRIQQAC